jgi:hypothetical protein
MTRSTPYRTILIFILGYFKIFRSAVPARPGYEGRKRNSLRILVLVFGSVDVIAYDEHCYSNSHW